MDTVFTFTVSQLFSELLRMCAAVATIAVAVVWIVKAIKKIKEPNKQQNERLTALESRVAQHDAYFTNDRRRFEEVEEGERVTQKAILALLSHGIDGNDIEAMKAAKNELQEYLLKR